MRMHLKSKVRKSYQASRFDVDHIVLVLERTFDQQKLTACDHGISLTQLRIAEHSEANQALQISNSGSGTISSFHLLGGLPVLVDQEPTGGSEPVAVAEHNGIVYVLNAGGNGKIS